MASPDFQLFSSLRYDPLLTSISENTKAWPIEAKDGSPFYMLPNHRDRILQAAQHFGWTKVVDALSGQEGFTHLLNKLTKEIDTQSKTPMKVRILLSHEGLITVESNSVPAVTEFNLFPNRLPPPKGKPEMKVSPLTGGALTVGEGESVYGDPPMDQAWEIRPDTIKTSPSLHTSFKTTSRDMYTFARERVGITDMAEKKEVLIISEKDGEIMEGSLTTVFFWRGGRWVTPRYHSGGQIGTTRRWALEKGLAFEEIVKVGDLVDGEECWFSNGVRGFQWGKVKLEE
ncbi:uncharacterized protein LY89DRAFT_688324 [Mollisia scopiformis]|uniref:Aminodeoxychorismate lyase n=1 Tax=Mollisia scopiformis TaxID=149040 RepID=A0A194WVW8_MOLSC|nr:uncharacterized protein LY89DRAFT_688324 [Mollisia scopiformis]KUJ11824.1 hypothetical protein LY89DRAFT_688324 [Mollisia scopiformis]